jgi:hypothetical protein
METATAAKIQRQQQPRIATMETLMTYPTLHLCILLKKIKKNPPVYPADGKQKKLWSASAGR